MRAVFLLAIFCLSFSSTVIAGGARPSDVEATQNVTSTENVVSENVKVVSAGLGDVTANLEVEDVEVMEPEVTLGDKLATYRFGGEDVVEAVPTPFRSYIGLNYPENDLITVKSKIVVKGKNGFMTPTFINNFPVRLRGDGHFFFEHSLETFGKQSIFVSFLTPDNHYFTVERRVLRLYSPSDIDDYSVNRREFIYFFNTHFLHDPNRTMTLGAPLTRADLAYFVSRLVSPNGPQSNFSVYFEDIDPGSWMSPYISDVVASRVMSEFPDGLFRPSNQVDMTEYLMTLVRALGYDLEQSDDALPFKDLDATHWSAKFVRTALREGLILPDRQLEPNKKLTIADFITLAQRVKSVQQELDNLASFGDGFGLGAINYDVVFSPLYKTLVEQEERLDSIRGIRFESPKTNQVVFGDSVLFEGQIFPSEPFDIGDIRVTPNPLGFFSAEILLEEGDNHLSIEVMGKSHDFQLHRLKSYADLNSHWLESTAAQLRYLGITEDQTDFLPNELVDRSDFLVWLSRALEWNLEDVTLEMLPSDVDTLDPYYPVIAYAIKYGVLSIDSEGLFRPDAPLTKAEALTAIMRITDFSNAPVVFTEAFPFWDVSKSHWVRGTVEDGLKYGVVSASAQFYPKKMVSRAELAAMLYRLPPVQQRIKAILPE